MRKHDAAGVHNKVHGLLNVPERWSSCPCFGSPLGSADSIWVVAKVALTASLMHKGGGYAGGGGIHSDGGHRLQRPGLDSPGRWAGALFNGCGHAGDLAALLQHPLQLCNSTAHHGAQHSQAVDHAMPAPCAL